MSASSLLRMSALGFMSAASIALPALAEDVVRGGTITVGRPDEPVTLDPFLPSDNGSIYAIAQICEPLVSADKDGTGLVPGVAESWTASDDGLTYTFTLREGISFSNGDPVTPQDVVFSLGKVMEPTQAYSFSFEPIASVTAPDDRTVQITLRETYAPLLSSLSLFAASIVEESAYTADPASFGTAPVCTGPFKVESFERGSQLVLVPNTHYWGTGEDGAQLPYVDKVVLRYMPDSNSRTLGLRNGDLDAVVALPFNQAASVREIPGIAIEESASFRLDYVYLNHARAPLDDKRIRLALNYATNHEALMRAVYYGFGETPNSYMPKVNFWSPNVDLIPFDMDRAKQLVADAGYDGEPIALMVGTGDADARQTATILRASWAEAGLKVDIVEYDIGTAFGMTQEGNYQAYVSYITSDINDSDELATLQADGSGATHAFFSNYNNPEVTTLLGKARATVDESERAALYEEVQRIVYNDGYSVPLNFRPYVNGYNERLHNWHNIAVGWWWLKDMWLSE